MPAPRGERDDTDKRPESSMKGINSRPLLLPALFFLLGIAAAGLFKTEFSSRAALWLILSQLFALAFQAFYVRFSFMFRVSTAVLFFLMGFFRYTCLAGPSENGIELLAGEKESNVFVYGEVVSDPETYFSFSGESLYFDLYVRKAVIEGKETGVSGKVRAVKRGRLDEVPGFGDKVVMSGGISLFETAMNPETLDFRRVMALSGKKARIYSGRTDIFSLVENSLSPAAWTRQTLASLREKASGLLGRYLDGEALFMARSTALGLRRGVDKGIKDALKKTGTSHILAVSGLHVGIAAALFLMLLRALRFPAGFGRFMASLGMLAFAVFAGCRSSSLRAAIMGSLFLLSFSFSRKPDVINALLVSAFIVTFTDPGQIFSAGFILSYLAVLSITALTPMTDHFFGLPVRPVKFPGAAGVYFLKIVSVSLAVWAGTMPVTARYFGMVTPSCVIANLAALPYLFAMVTLSFAVIVFGAFPFVGGLAELSARLMTFITGLFTRLLEAISSFPAAYTRVARPGVLMTAVFYAGLVTAALLFKKSGKKVYFAAFLIFAANIFMSRELSFAPPENTLVTIFSTGKSDAAVVEFREGAVMLVDSGTGGKRPEDDSAEGVIIPYLASRGVRKIDCALITHFHEDHTGGFWRMLDDLKIGAVLIPSALYGKEEGIYGSLMNRITNKKIPVTGISRQDSIEGFEGAEIEVLNPPREKPYGDANLDSVVIKLTTGTGNSVLFLADTGGDALKEMMMYGEDLKSDVVKVPHHGGFMGDGKTAEEFLKLTGARYFVVTNASGVSLNPALCRAAEAVGAKILVTGATGAVRFTDSPGGFFVETFTGGKWVSV